MTEGRWPENVRICENTFNSFYSLYYDRTTASCKDSSAHSAIWCFLLQLSVPSLSFPYVHPIAAYFFFPRLTSLFCRMFCMRIRNNEVEGKHVGQPEYAARHNSACHFHGLPCGAALLRGAFKF